MCARAQILQRAAQGDRQWSLLRVAVIGLRDDVFVGRLFFGDPETGVVAWDCDCRPSDGCFLSIKVWHGGVHEPGQEEWVDLNLNAQGGAC
eukprot:157146-Chlamydomonas_euryale.AAC.2